MVIQFIGLVLLTAPLAATDRIVENGLVPTGDRVTLRFEENLRIGGDSDEDHHAWSGATVAVEVNSKGHMFVADTGGNRIVEFDPTGKFVRMIGGPGKGPGEYRAMMSLRILHDDRAIAFDNLQTIAIFNSYDRDMTLVDSARYPSRDKIMRAAIFSPGGDYLSAFYMSVKDKKLITYTGVLDRNLELKIPLHQRAVMPFDGNKVNDPSWWSAFYSSWFELCVQGLGLVAFADNGSVYTALTTKYEITQYDPNLNKQTVFTRQYKPISQSAEDLDAFADPIRAEIISSLPAHLHKYITPTVVTRAIEKADFPPGKQPLFGLVPMEDGLLLAVHDFDPKTNRSKADIFDRNGKYVGVADLPKVSINIFGGFFGNPVKLSFKNGFAYAIEVDEYLEPTLVRYKYEIQAAK